MSRLFGFAAGRRAGAVARTAARRRDRRIAVEPLESRALLAVSASMVGSELLISLSEAGDAASLAVEGGSYAVRSGSQSIGTYSAATVAAIRVQGDAAQPGQSLFVRPGGVIADPLTVDAGVDATVVQASIVTTGAVRIESATVTLADDVRTSGSQTYSGLLRVADDIVLDAGTAAITIGGQIRSTVGRRATIMEAMGAPNSLAVSPNGQTLYASDAVSNYVYFIDLAGQTLQTVDLGKSVGHVALSPNGSRLFVANSLDGSVTVLDTSNRAILATLAVVGTPEGMAFSPDGQTLYVANYSENSVAVLNPVTNRLLRTIPVGGNPIAVAVAPNGRLWVASESLNQVSVVDPAAGTILATISVGRGPADIALSPDGSRAYVANNFDSTLSVIDTATSAIVATVGVGSGPTEIAASADGRTVYVVDGFSNSVTVVDAAAASVATTVPVGTLPVGIALAADGRTAYVANLDSLSELGNDARSLTVRTTGTARFDSPPSTVDPLRELVVAAGQQIGPTPVLTPLESAGTSVLARAADGRLYVNQTLVTYNGGPVNYPSMTASGWQPVAAETVGGVNTIVLRHSSGHLHFWRLDATWTQVSGDGWVGTTNPDYFTAETTFATDFNGDGAVGSLSVTIESTGTVVLTYGSAGNLRANGKRIFYNGTSINYHTMVASGWTVVAADVVNAVNTVVLKHSSGNLHFWRMSATWGYVSSDGWLGTTNPDYFTTETTFGLDFNGDNAIGSLSITIESAGSVILTYGSAGNLRANGKRIFFNGSSLNYLTTAAGGWTVMAADVVGGVNTLVLKHSSGFLHFWRMNASWAQVSGDGWLAPGSAEALATESTFGVDINGNGTIGT